MPSILDTDAIGRLQVALDARANEKSRRFWETYLKGEASFRGVPMSGVRHEVHAWWQSEGLHERSAAVQKKTALRLFEGEHTEDKLAGVLALSEILLPSLFKRDLPSFARLFARGYIADWNLSDWFCVKVLGKMVERAEDPTALANAISAWRTSKPLWQRRASCVAFVNLAKHGGREVPRLPIIIVESCTEVVRDPERFTQTGVSWVLRELSLSERRMVVRFAVCHLDRLSKEAIKGMTDKMPGTEINRLLALHAEAGKAKRRTA